MIRYIPHSPVSSHGSIHLHSPHTALVVYIYYSSDSKYESFTVHLQLQLFFVSANCVPPAVAAVATLIFTVPPSCSGKLQVFFYSTLLIFYTKVSALLPECSINTRDSTQKSMYKSLKSQRETQSQQLFLGRFLQIMVHVRITPCMHC